MSTHCRQTKTVSLGYCAVLALAAAAKAQVRLPSSQRAPLPSFVAASAVPSNAREYLIALGDRIQKPGKERLTLVGRSTDPKNGTTTARIVWETPGRVRLERGSGTAALVFDDVAGVVNARGVSAEEAGILESLANDSVEAFLYGFSRGHAYRFLGARFRTDNGKNPAYSGPWFDIYEMMAPPQAVAAGPSKLKLFYFDSINKFHVRTAYVMERAGAKIPVTTEFNNWTSAGGQATPGQIVRRENGTAVFTFDVTAASTGAKANDGLFPGR